MPTVSILFIISAGHMPRGTRSRWVFWLVSVTVSPRRSLGCGEQRFAQDGLADRHLVAVAGERRGFLEGGVGYALEPRVGRLLAPEQRRRIGARQRHRGHGAETDAGVLHDAALAHHAHRGGRGRPVEAELLAALAE